MDGITFRQKQMTPQAVWHYQVITSYAENKKQTFL